MWGNPSYGEKGYILSRNLRTSSGSGKGTEDSGGGKIIKEQSLLKKKKNKGLEDKEIEIMRGVLLDQCGKKGNGEGS